MSTPRSISTQPKTLAKNGVRLISISALLTTTEMTAPKTPPPTAPHTTCARLGAARMDLRNEPSNTTRARRFARLCKSAPLIEAERRSQPGRNAHIPSY